MPEPIDTPKTSMIGVTQFQKSVLVRQAEAHEDIVEQNESNADSGKCTMGQRIAKERHPATDDQRADRPAAEADQHEHATSARTMIGSEKKP